jgi:chromosome partitioning protein
MTWKIFSNGFITCKIEQESTLVRNNFSKAINISSKLLNTIKIIKSKLNPQLEIEGFLLTMYDSRLRLANQIYEEVKRHFRELVFTTVIQRNIKLSEAPSYGIPALLYDAESRGAVNHMQLARELIDKNK